MSIESQAVESPTDATTTDLPMKSKKAKKPPLLVVCASKTS